MLVTQNGLKLNKKYSIYCVNDSGLSIVAKDVILKDYTNTYNGNGAQVEFEFTRQKDIDNFECISFGFNLKILKDSSKQYFIVEKIFDSTNYFLGES
jgi:hypothetical protein